MYMSITGHRPLLTNSHDVCRKQGPVHKSVLMSTALHAVSVLQYVRILPRDHLSKSEEAFRWLRHMQTETPGYLLTAAQLRMYRTTLVSYIVSMHPTCVLMHNHSFRVARPDCAAYERVLHGSTRFLYRQTQDHARCDPQSLRASAVHASPTTHVTTLSSHLPTLQAQLLRVVRDRFTKFSTSLGRSAFPRGSTPQVQSGSR
ncbi:hypothetical protein BD310DRAFT_930427 [Dichomitus squalens]|uniref:Uncharacterized protein n=1 Tax=Dichomitus squalens TaxID=114155 RepID=A0A4Q9PRK0_9APHY|nr:hypothetical protein BD310DRAFT_930427 [Dichomitus squalens]